MFIIFRDSLAFATEPVFASLANVLGKIEALPQNAIEELRVGMLFEYLYANECCKLFNSKLTHICLM